MARFQGTLVGRPRFGGKLVTEAEPAPAPAQAPPTPPTPAQVPPTPAPASDPIDTFLTGAGQSIVSMLQGVPMAEAAANLVTSTYGVPLTGLAGLLALPFGTDTAENVMNKAQEVLIYQPQSQGGQQLQKAVGYPMEKLHELAGATVERTGLEDEPAAAAAVHTAVEGLPVIIGARIAHLRTPAKRAAVLDAKTAEAVSKGIDKAIKPSVTGKDTAGKLALYKQKAKTAVEEIVKRKDDLKYVDETGTETTGLPKTLNEFSQAIEQTKRQVFEEYDALAKITDKEAAPFSMKEAISELDKIIDSEPLNAVSPETVKYAFERQASLESASITSATELQETIQILNQSLEHYHRAPSPATKGKALVDALIANKFREQLDSKITKATGQNYRQLKQTYGSLRSIEKDVTKSAMADARKAGKGLIDFTDIFIGDQIVRGMILKDPSMIGAGAAAKSISLYYKYLNNPNRLVKNMFSEVDKLKQQ